MWRAIGRLYQHRIVNVNVNILVAGVLALAPAVAAAKGTYWLLGTDDPESLSHPQRLLIAGVTFVTDVVFDVAIYFVLHWLANHLPQRLKRASGASIVLDAAHVPFLRDATVVQLQRAILSPVLYLGWLGTQYALMSHGYGPGRSTVIGWCVGIIAARTLHTIWMIRAQRWARRKLAAAVQAVVPGVTLMDPPSAPAPPIAPPPPPKPRA
jgi:uncharacterized membrane protein YjjB (DUF3815 family)